MADTAAAPPADQAKKKAKAKKMEKPEKPPEEQGEKTEKKKKKEKASEPPAEGGAATKPPEPQAPPAEEASKPPAPPAVAPAEGEAPPPPAAAAAEEATAPAPPAPDTTTEGEPTVNEIVPAEEQGEAAASAAEAELEADTELNEEAEIPEEVKAPPKERVFDRNILHRIDEAKLKELQEAFELMDINSDGFIDAKDLQLTFVTLGRTAEDTEIMDMIGEGPKPMDFEGFVSLLGSRTIDLDPEDILMAALSLWDKEGKGLIDEEMFRMSLTGWGDKFTQEEVDIVLGDAPYYTQSGTPMINYVEFCKQISSSAIKKS